MSSKPKKKLLRRVGKRFQLSTEAIIGAILLVVLVVAQNWKQAASDIEES